MVFSFEIFDDELKNKISFRQVDFDKDAELLYRWMNEEHVIPYWKLNGPKETYFQHLLTALHDEHQKLYIGYVNGRPVSYWESYWVRGDVMEEAYEAEPNDQGVHLLIGETDCLGKGYSLPMLKAMVRFQFQKPFTEKVIAEPDIRNKKMIHVFEKCGFVPIEPVKLPDKTGLLMFCDRDAFHRRWKYEDKHRLQTHI
ncbi:GNAT family N-acetyltransferase [Fictibacillus terranigra]|uniref:Lysine N-acyltransferase MbtK n=1 Tax=Fictibacillus terranigra TaxID=3058424 RepID=A0ABT8E7V5_9BACL|nr:GNAT family N-acetyltransferase [Fictibacillus sp. CENA-BCM004]MDN4073975.1 GNAT family N-acetyltransferase [Fictibacillus sp. CENA-BCM004]